MLIFFILDRERGRERMSQGGAESEGSTECEAVSRTEPDAGLEPTNYEIMT